MHFTIASKTDILGTFESFAVASHNHTTWDTSASEWWLWVHSVHQPWAMAKVKASSVKYTTSFAAQKHWAGCLSKENALIDFSLVIRCFNKKQPGQCSLLQSRLTPAGKNLPGTEKVVGMHWTGPVPLPAEPTRTGQILPDDNICPPFAPISGGSKPSYSSGFNEGLFQWSILEIIAEC